MLAQFQSLSILGYPLATSLLHLPPLCPTHNPHLLNPCSRCLTAALTMELPLAVLMRRHDELGPVSFRFHGLYTLMAFFICHIPPSTPITAECFPSDLQLGEELWLYTQEVQHSFSQVSISQGRARSQGSPSRAEPKCLAAC